MSPNLAAPQGLLNGGSVGANLSKHIGIVKGRRTRDSFPDQLEAEEVDDAGD